MKHTIPAIVRRTILVLAVSPLAALAAQPAPAAPSDTAAAVAQIEQAAIQSATVETATLQPARIDGAAAMTEATTFLDPGKFIWNPDPAASGPVKIVVSIPLQIAYVFKGTTLIGTSSVSTGLPGYDTPTGAFTILQKEVDHKSSLYDDAPMPFMQRLTWDGVALHAGKVTGEPASHGCVRLPAAFAKKLYGETRLGAQVVIVDEAPLSAEQAFAVTPPKDLLASR